jgi:ABC-type multidrug transport system fused ATPase/permease subunit
MDIATLSLAIGEFILWVVVGVIVAWIIGKLVDIILDRTVERGLDKTGIGKELREIGLDFSDTIGFFTGAAIFLLFLELALSYLPAASGIWNTVVYTAAYLVNVVAALAFVTAGFLFVVWFVEYVGKFVRRYNEDVAKFIKMALAIGMIWAVAYYALVLLKLQYTLFNQLLFGFVVLSVGAIVIDVISPRLEEAKEFKPYLEYFLYGLFVLVAVNAIFSTYVPVKVINIFAYGYVALFVLAIIPAIAKAIKKAL